jgi:hypothetical protein
MPFLKVQDTITITASGGSFTLDTTASTEIYNIIGTATMISNVTIAPTNTATTGLTYVFNYKAILDITTNSTSVTIFGQALTAPQALNSQEIICTYNGTSWDVDIQSSFDDSNIVSTSNIQNNAITSSKIAPGAISTSSLADDSVTNAKLATMTLSSVKIGGSTGNPADLALGNNEIPIGNGTTVTTYDLSTLMGRQHIVTIPVSFESNEQSINSFYVPFNCTITEARFCVTKDLSGTNAGHIQLIINNGATALSPTLNITASTPADSELAFGVSGGAVNANTMFQVYGYKTTPGGKGLVTVILEQT